MYVKIVTERWSARNEFSPRLQSTAVRSWNQKLLPGCFWLRWAMFFFETTQVTPGWVGILSLPPALSIYSVRGIQQYTEREQRAKEINIISSPTMLSLLPSLWLISLCAKREAWKTSPQNIFCYYRLHSRIFWCQGPKGNRYYLLWDDSSEVQLCSLLGISNWHGPQTVALAQFGKHLQYSGLSDPHLQP